MKIQEAMAQATLEILSNTEYRVFGGTRPDGRKPVDGYDINCGLCFDWADRVEELCRGAHSLEPIHITGIEDDDIKYGHAFVLYRGKYYDAECTEGVADWKDIPLIKRNHFTDNVVSELESQAELLNPIISA